MEKVLFKVFLFFSPLLLLRVFDAATASPLVIGNSVELIGSEPKCFSETKSFRIEPNVLPRVGGTQGRGLSVTFWIMVQKFVHGWTVIFHCGHDPHRTPATWFYSGSTRVHVRVSTKSNKNEGGDSSGNVFNLNKWHHAAYVLDDNQLLFYVDGKVVMSYLLAGDAIYSDGTLPFFIGHDTKYNSFNGQLKYFRLYDFPLSKAEVKQDKSSLQPITVAEPICNTVVDFYESLVNNSTHSDVTFLVNGTKVYGHKTILSAKSPYFERVLEKHTSQREPTMITIPGVSVEMFITLMKYLYAGRVPSDPQEAIKLMIVIDYLSIGSSKADSYNTTLEGKLTISNACQLLSIADNFVPYQKSLVDMIMTFMSKKDNYKELIDGDELYLLPPPLFRKFLKFSLKAFLY